MNPLGSWYNKIGDIMKRALVLSGGGSKGAYQIGAIKALQKLNQSFDIVVGTSIGAINAALYAQKRNLLARIVWSKLTTEKLFQTKKESLYKHMIKEFLHQGGISFYQAELLLRKYIKEKKVRSSNIEYGLVTYSLKTKSPRMLSIKEIPKGKLIDYIIASATCYPAIQKKEIDGEYFIDGGYYDNLPINLAISLGAEEVVAIDLKVFAKKQKVKEKNIPIDMITCQDKTPFTINFTKENTDRFMKLGYYDTMKHYHALDGEYYTFHKNEIIKHYQSYKEEYTHLLMDILFLEDKSKIAKEILNISKYNTLFSNIAFDHDISYTFLETIEYLGKIFELSPLKIYTIHSFQKEILKKVNRLNYLEVGRNLKGKMLVSYIYHKYKKTKDKKELSKEMFNMALFFPKEFLASIYLIGITTNISYRKEISYYKKELKKLQNY